jgi:cytochrome c biogenesis factor
VQPDNALFLEVTSYRKPAIAVLSIGAALLVAGVVMVAVDRARGRRRDGTRAEVHRSMMLGSLD